MTEEIENERTQCTFGVANIFKDTGDEKITEFSFRPDVKEFGLQFYDYDGFFDGKDFEKVKRIFPNDLIIYKSKNGFHFISFALQNIDKTIRNANKLSHKFKDQDYILPVKECSYLVLRIAPKWNKSSRILASEQPIYYIIWKFPTKDTVISLPHLEFYHDKMGLPDMIYNFYKTHCKLKNGLIYFIYYTTGDKIKNEITTG